MTEIEKQEMIGRMSSICRNCQHIKVRDDIKIFYCQKFEKAVTGIVLDCPKGFEYMEGSQKFDYEGTKTD